MLAEICVARKFAFCTSMIVCSGGCALQHVVARKVAKYHAANKIQKELAAINMFVQEQLRTRVTSRGMLDRILKFHKTMARELFEEMDEDKSGVPP